MGNQTKDQELTANTTRSQVSSMEDIEYLRKHPDIFVAVDKTKEYSPEKNSVASLKAKLYLAMKIEVQSPFLDMKRKVLLTAAKETFRNTFQDSYKEVQGGL